MNSRWLPAALVLSALLLAAHLAALTHFLYWRHWWFDIVMHALGGAALAALALAVVGRRRVPFFLALTAAIIGWEAFELIAHISTGQHDYWLDTAADIVIGMAAATAFYLIAARPASR